MPGAYFNKFLADLKGAISCIEGVVSVPFAADLQQGLPKDGELQNGTSAKRV